MDLKKTHFVVLSHYHWDHAKGLLDNEFKTKKYGVGEVLTLQSKKEKKYVKSR